MFTRLLQPLIVRAEHRLPALTRRKAAEPLPVLLDRRRIYILPSAYGLAFAALLLVMLLGSLNYTNNAALLLTCLLGAVVINSMLLTFRALDQLSLVALHHATVHAGEAVSIQLRFAGNGRSHRALQLDVAEQSIAFAVRANDLAREVNFSMPSTQRGWVGIPRLRILSHYPFGWFRAWSWLAPERKILVYPRLEKHGPPPPLAGEAQQAHRLEHGDEWSGLRDYRQGDPLKQVAWKASARTEQLRVKTFDQPQASAPWHLAWSSIELEDNESRIQRLARWVSEAYVAGRSWSLDLPEQQFASATGSAHFHRCMRALAELP
ncbi:MAG: DUF58 domain-containing protein [Xanthomonadales bacterium]|nr:DUF58 domain-containing protein [Xanthomonadales bacterium]